MLKTLTLPTLALLVLTSLACQAPPADAPPAATPPAAETAAAPAADTATAPAVDIRNARTPLPGVLTGGQPTVEQFEAAAAAGYRTVVNMRTDGEEGTWDEATKAAELGLVYHHIPVAGAEGLTVENARALAEIVEDPASHPVMVHCGSGNRIGALFALKAFHLDGKTPEEALEIGRDAGLTRLEPTVRELLGLPEAAPSDG